MCTFSSSVLGMVGVSGVGSSAKPKDLPFLLSKEVLNVFGGALLRGGDKTRIEAFSGSNK